MFQLVKHLDKTKQIAVAFSGGIDSMVLCEFLQKKKFDVHVMFFDHRNGYSEKEFQFAAEYASYKKLPFICGTRSREKLKSESDEEYWRNMRYEFFKSFNMTIATGHTLDDAVEWFLFTAFNGEGHIMPYQHHNVVRPFLLTSKEQIKAYAVKNNLIWLEDASNRDIKFAARNRIRHNILPEVLQINPGIYKVIKKKILAKYSNQ